METKTTIGNIEDLNENSKNVNATFRVMEIYPVKIIRSKSGDKKVQQVKVADATGCLLFSLWDKQIGKIAMGDTLTIQNGFISVVKNSMRLNIGRYGKLLLAEEALVEVNVENNLSEKYIENHSDDRKQSEENRRNDEKRNQNHENSNFQIISSEKTNQVTITRTIYDPASKDFVIDSGSKQTFANIKEWISSHNSAIYWYILRIDNPNDSDISQWAVELYTHQALTITEAYIEDSDKRFPLRKSERDTWNEKYILSIPKQSGIPIVGKGLRRIIFKIDINCKQGLMHEYGISGKFIAQGIKDVDIREKMFKYSCSSNQFKEIFSDNPEDASDYAKERLRGRYSTYSVQIFTNTFRLIHDLSGYCHFNTKNLDQDILISKLAPLQDSFEIVPEIAGRRIIPLLRDEIEKLTSVRDQTLSTSRYLNLCNKLVEYLHMEVMGADVKSGHVHSVPADDMPGKKTANAGQKECPVCGNVITESNKSLLCMKCRSRFCLTCEEWFRVEQRKRGEKPLCEKCFNMEEEKKIEDERIKKEREEAERIESENEKTKQEEEGEKAEKREREKEEQKKLRREEEKKEEERDRIKRENEKRAKEEQEWLRKKEEEGRRKKEEIPKTFTFTSSIGMEFVLIPTGEFIMGSEDNEWEKPVHKVKISKPFYLGTYPVTQKEWKAVMGNNPSRFEDDNLPVETVSWNDVQDFIKKLNEKEGTNKYRLPSEAEWEYSARAGTTTMYSFGDDVSKLGDYAYYSSNSVSETHEVGKKKPNPWGLYDMHGNVWEWVQDKWYGNYNNAPTDGSSRESGDSSDRVIRGGSWQGDSRGCRSAIRSNNYTASRGNNLGLRPLRDL